jgi:uncharacterized protein YyaL (SSP411 family)
MSSRKAKQRNRLSSEKNPYLLQHANNPVDWFPWGTEAFEKARSEHKPIFLSIGYATCHWCHVMAHESFEDPQVARLMNRVFISVKVDREERPDLDSVYMTACQMMTGSGGWPLTIIMTPDKKPFFAGTYIPRESRYGRIGMLELIPKIQQLWEQQRDEVINTSEHIADSLLKATQNVSHAVLEPSILHQTFTELVHRFDDTHGGFSNAPKFPTPHNLMYLLRYWKRTNESNGLMMVTKTLDAMRQGGIYDHVGFGFHRYSTDAQWLVPHFEKMLYDQALLALAYTEAFQATGSRLYRDTAREILTFVTRDMTSPEGGFYSALDADTEGEEGRTYVWTFDEIASALGEDASLFSRIFNITKEGNYAEEAIGMRTGRNIPHRSFSWKELADTFGMEEQKLCSMIELCRQKLFETRQKRAQPHIDDKVLTDWNGLMIAAFAMAGRVFEDRRFIESALRAAEFILLRMRTEKGRLLHSYRDDQASVAAFIDDYAFLIWGLIELYEATFDVQYLLSANSLSEIAIEHFWDTSKGGFFLSADDGEALIVRKKEIYDGALPSGNSVAMLNLARLGALTASSAFRIKAEGIGKAFSDKALQAPSAHTFLLVALDFLIGPSYEVVIAGESGSEDTREMLSALSKSFIPNAVILFRDCGAEVPDTAEIAPFSREQTCIEGKATAYVCRSQNCKLPTTHVKKMLDMLCEK